MNLRGMVVGAVLVTGLASGGWLIGRGLATNETSFSGARLFEQVSGNIRRYYIDSISDSTMYTRATIGMLRELGDPYTLYLPPRRLARLTERTTGNYIGIGAQIQRRDEWPMIIEPFPGSPAERAGLHTGDRVVEIDGVSTRGLTVDEVTRNLRGVPGSDVKLVIERPGDPRRMPLTLTRGGVHRRAVARTALLPGGVGYVDVNVFNDSTELELRQAVDSLSGAGMRSLIMDLRGNPGGVMTQGVGVAELFLDKGVTIVQMHGRTRDANQMVVDSLPQRWAGLPLVVLIDAGSASASEIVAGALQDHDRALLLGRTSFGKGSAQGVFPTVSGGAVKLTTTRWFTPSGRSIDRPRGTEDAEDATSKRAAYRTEHGRTVYGGGGIVPDVAFGDTALSPPEQALEDALGTRVIDFRDAMVDVAIRLKTRNAIRSREFDVTPAMLDELWQAMRERKFRFERGTLDGARPLVTRLLAREIARYVFGPQAEAERSIADDELVREATRLLDGVRTPSELMARTERPADARKP